MSSRDHLWTPSWSFGQWFAGGFFGAQSHLSGNAAAVGCSAYASLVSAHRSPGSYSDTSQPSPKFYAVCEGSGLRLLGPGTWTTNLLILGRRDDACGRRGLHHGAGEVSTVSAQVSPWCYDASLLLTLYYSVCLWYAAMHFSCEQAGFPAGTQIRLLHRRR
jgi:hypothetical protein